MASAAASGGGGSNLNSSSTASTELFWSLLDKADRKFSRLRELPPIPRSRGEREFQKAFKLYTRLWKLQQELRERLMEAGLKRWEVGEIASRIAQLYHGQYLRTSDATCLSEAYIFYEAVLTREYFKDSGCTPAALATKQLRFLARFLIVCLLLNRREMVIRLAGQLRALVDEFRRNFHESEFKEWKHVVQEVARYLKADSPFMNMRPLRYSYVFDPHPDSFSSGAPFVSRRNLVLRDSILSSYRQNEVKLTEVTLDTFRMLQSLEWEPQGLFSLKVGADTSNSSTGPNRVNPLKDIRDLTLPPNPRKIALYKPSITQFLMVLGTICEELPADGILLIYLSASGESASQNTGDSNIGNSDEIVSLGSFSGCPDESSLQDTHKNNSGDCLWLGARGSRDSNCLYPCDLIPFTRKPLFLVVDSNNSHAFKAIHGEEKGETAAILLSPALGHPSLYSATDPSWSQNGSYFTIFLTAPVQAFCLLLRISSDTMDKDKYDKSEELLSLSLNELAACLMASDSLQPVWLEVLDDPFLRRLLLRFIFCRAILGLFAPTSICAEFRPICLPYLPGSVDPDSPTCQTAVMRLASFFNVPNQFLITDSAALQLKD